MVRALFNVSTVEGYLAQPAYQKVLQTWSTGTGKAQVRPRPPGIPLVSFTGESQGGRLTRAAVADDEVVSATVMVCTPWIANGAARAFKSGFNATYTVSLWSAARHACRDGVGL